MSLITTTRAAWVEKLLYLDGAPFSLADYPIYTDIYNNIADATLLKTARQVATRELQAEIRDRVLAEVFEDSAR